MVGYTLRGKGFARLPDNVVGIQAESNDNPLKNRYGVNRRLLFNVDTKTDTEMTLIAADGGSTHGGSVYLGAVLSSDREMVYWLNDTRPLPEE